MMIMKGVRKQLEIEFKEEQAMNQVPLYIVIGSMLALHPKAACGLVVAILLLRLMRPHPPRLGRW